MTRIIALIDGSVFGQSVCDYAAWAAERTQASIDLLHVLGRRETHTVPANLSGNLTLGAHGALMDRLITLDEERARLARERGRAILDAAATRVADRVAQGSAANVSTRMRNGDLVEELQAIEGDSDLIIAGKRGEAADFAKAHLGSNLERIVRASTKPVLVTPPAFAPVERALIAFDNGPSARKAVTYIATKGRLFRSVPLHILTVGQDTPQQRAAQDEAAAALRAAGYDVTAEIRPGEPDSVIADHIRERSISLMVMGAYGHSRIRSLMIGSTTTQMIRSCDIPVLLFR